MHEKVWITRFAVNLWLVGVMGFLHAYPALADDRCTMTDTAKVANAESITGTGTIRLMSTMNPVRMTEAVRVLGLDHVVNRLNGEPQRLTTD